MHRQASCHARPHPRTAPPHTCNTLNVRQICANQCTGPRATAALPRTSGENGRSAYAPGWNMREGPCLLSVHRPHRTVRRREPAAAGGLDGRVPREKRNRCSHTREPGRIYFRYTFARPGAARGRTPRHPVSYPTSAPVAQLDRALPSGGRGQGFESLRARHLRCRTLVIPGPRAQPEGARLARSSRFTHNARLAPSGAPNSKGSPSRFPAFGRTGFDTTVRRALRQTTEKHRQCHRRRPTALYRNLSILRWW